MKRKIMCNVLKRIEYGLEETPFESELGRKIYDCVSEKAWNQWVEFLIKVINEYRLDLSNSNHRNALLKEMNKFFNFNE